MYEIDIVIDWTGDVYECATLRVEEKEELLKVMELAFKSGYEVVVRNK